MRKVFGCFSKQPNWVLIKFSVHNLPVLFGELQKALDFFSNNCFSQNTLLLSKKIAMLDNTVLAPLSNPAFGCQAFFPLIFLVLAISIHPRTDNKLN
jgi:hypothetical protein